MTIKTSTREFMPTVAQALLVEQEQPLISLSSPIVVLLTSAVSTCENYGTMLIKLDYRYLS